jgi:hypothetical protein
MSSWFNKIAKTVTETVEQVKVAAEATYNDLKSYPTEHPCSGCDQVLALPPNLFVWECEVNE